MKLAIFSGKADRDDAAPVVGPAQAELNSLDRQIERLSDRHRLLSEQAASYDEERRVAQLIADQPARIQEQIAAAESAIAKAELDGTSADASKVKVLRRELAAALEAAEDAASKARIAALKVQTRRADLAAVASDQRILHNTRTRAVVEVLRERIAAQAPQFEAATKAFLDEYFSTYSLVAAHDRLCEEQALGNFLGARGFLNLQLPAPEGYPAPPGREEWATRVGTGAIAVLRDLKVHT